MGNESPRKTKVPESPDQRRFTLADAMILIGAAAIGFALARAWNYLLDPNARSLHARWFPVYVGLFLIPIGVGMRVIRHRAPRTNGCEILRRTDLPWVIAMAWAPLQFTINFLPNPALRGSTVVGVLEEWSLNFGASLPKEVGPMIALLAIMAMLTGSHVREVSWVDRAERVYGWAWIALWAGDAVYRCWRRW